MVNFKNSALDQRINRGWQRLRIIRRVFLLCKLFLMGLSMGWVSHTDFIGFCSRLVEHGEVASLGEVLSFSYNLRGKNNNVFVSIKKLLRFI